MGEKTGIEWADHTFNPWWGCEKVSAACTHCYAQEFADRFPKTRGLWGPDAPRKIASEKVWNDPIRWNRAAERDGVRRRVFCASMADVFEDRRDLDEHRARLFRLIFETPSLDWLLLTKRPDKIHDLMTRAAHCAPLGNDRWADHLDTWEHGPWSNVWLGTTVEDQARADERIPELLAIPARVRFLSCEPLLGPVDLSRWVKACGPECWAAPRCTTCHKPKAPVGRSVALAASGSYCEDGCSGYRSEPKPGHYWPGEEADGINRSAVSWVIVGGESGSDPRPMHPAWARSIRDQCAAAGVPFFFKQWGEWVPRERDDGSPFNSLETERHALIDIVNGLPHCAQEFAGEGYACMSRVGKKTAGCSLLDGVEHKAFPEVER